MARLHGRITKDDIAAAGLRRWDGRGRVTTDWFNLYHEPELSFPNGDIFVYLREPGQSSRGPTFRVHSSQLKLKGFQSLVDRCTKRVAIHNRSSCITPSCQECGKTAPMRELYLPAPLGPDPSHTIDHHINIRNFFAWLYNRPLAGRTLGKTLVGLKEFIDVYRPDDEAAKNVVELVSFAEFQRYLDFRECVDHALAALHFAECVQLEDLWIDAFAHCVGLTHVGLHTSLEFSAISRTTKVMITKARLEMDVRRDRVGRSVINFFENDLSGPFLGLPQPAREHFDRFRSFLHAYYIEQHGFWPPQDFDDEAVQGDFYCSMYADFRNLYHHLVDMESKATLGDRISVPGGVCTLQNIQAFDARHQYEALPHPLPMLPGASNVKDINSPLAAKKPKSLNPLRRRKAERDARNEARMMALIAASNRDWNIMRYLIVRRYSDFEQQSILDNYETVSDVDGRKVRWILIYAILQTLISVMQAPKQVRNTEGLSYPLCCHPPKAMPWMMTSPTPLVTANSEKEKGKTELEPDINYSHTSSSGSSSSRSLSSSRERRKSLPAKPSTPTANKATAFSSRSPSIRKMLSNRRSSVQSAKTTPARPAFCEIFVEGYGNGLNEAKFAEPIQANALKSEETITQASEASGVTPSPENGPGSVSRESSNASGYSTRSSNTDESKESAPDMEHLSVNGDDTKSKRLSKRPDERTKMNEVHLNPQI